MAAVAMGMGVFSLMLVLFGFGNVEVTEQALNYSLLRRRADPKPYTAGRYWIGPFNYFIKFPAILTTIQFSDAKFQSDLALGGERELRSRTEDGLDVFIEISFQYQLQTATLYDLYTNLGGYPDYHNTFVRLAIDRLTEAATLFTANEFFVERTRIGKEMEDMVRKDFGDHLYSSIFSFQLRSVGLPREFEDAIQETEVMKQDVQVAAMEQNSTRVALETELMQAERRVKVKASKADGQAKSIMLANKADITQYLSMQEKSADSYSGVLSNLGSNEKEMLSYMQARVLRDHPADKTMVGMTIPGPV
jgi:hypothetical protein